MNTINQHFDKQPNFSKWVFILAALIMALLSSCKSKEKFVEKVSMNDSIYQSDLTVEIPDISYKITIDEICKDSVLQPINKVFTIGADTVLLWTENNSLKAYIQFQAKTIKEKDSIIKNSNKVKEVEKKVIKYRWHWSTYVTWILAALFILWQSGLLRFIGIRNIKF